MIFNLGYTGISSKKKPPQYTFTGKSKFLDEGEGNWALYFYSTGVFNISKLNNAETVDIFLVGHGAGGDSGQEWTSAVYGWGGYGGKGGPRKTIRNQRLDKEINYSIGISTQSTFTDGKNINLTSYEGTRSNGGGGGYLSSGSDAVNGHPGSAGEYPFGDAKYGCYGGGGGGGGGGSAPGGYGGSGGGASGGSYGYSGQSASANTGGGGGGGGGGGAVGSASGGYGATGLIIIRNHRENQKKGEK